MLPARPLSPSSAKEFLNAQQRAKLVQEGERKIRERLERLDQNDEDQALLEQLVRLISEGRLKVKVFTRSRLHAKAYIFDYPTDRFEKGISIVGSSNLSLAGLQDNTEFNVVVHGNANHEQLVACFNKLWDEAEPFAAELMTELLSSWALNDSLTPYDLYLKVLYHLTKDRLEEPDVPMPADFPPLADFQWVAVKSAIRILRFRHGVFISDVVGLGKSFIAAALLKWLKVRERQRALIICPTPLVKMWRDRFVDRYDLGAEVLSLGTSLPNALRSSKIFTATETKPAKPPAVFFFGQAGDFQRLWLADVEGNIVAEDNHSSLAAIICPPDEKRRKLPPDYNALVTKLKTKFDHQYQEYLAAGGTPHRLGASQRWALDTIRDVYKQSPDLFIAPDELKTAQERLERLRKLWSVSPIDARVEFALRGLRNQKPMQEEAINRLDSIAFEHKLDVLAEGRVEVSKLATEPVIICTEALV